MPKELAHIMQYINFDDDIVRELKKRVLGINSQNEAEALLEELEWRLDVSPQVHHYELSPFFYILISYCHIWDDHEENAIRASTNAIEKFRILGMAWFQGMAHWIRAHLYQRDPQNFHRRINDLLEARNILEPVCQNYRLEAQYERFEICQKVLQEIETDYAHAVSKGTKPLGPLPKHTPPIKTSPTDNRQNSYLSLGWLPIYQSVRAGTEGVTWIDPPPGKFSMASTIELENTLHKIITLRNRQVTLVQDLEYGWAKVKGHSMNNARPTPIEQGDYVLFIKINAPQDQDIIIAAQSVHTNEQAYMVKRYHKTTQSLHSETTDTTQAYNSLEITENFQILGIVLAVAKPI